MGGRGLRSGALGLGISLALLGVSTSTAAAAKPIRGKLRIAGRLFNAKRTTLRQHEAAHVMQLSVSETRTLLRRKTSPCLRSIYSGRRRDVDPQQHLAEQVRSNAIALEVLRAILRGDLHVRRPVSEDATPIALTLSVRALAVSDRPVI